LVTSIAPEFKLTLHLVVRSGLQRGGRFATLKGFQWPGDSSGLSVFLIAGNANP
jgi:hypothetical protein